MEWHINHIKTRWNWYRIMKKLSFQVMVCIRIASDVNQKDIKMIIHRIFSATLLRSHPFPNLSRFLTQYSVKVYLTHEPERWDNCRTIAISSFCVRQKRIITYDTFWLLKAKHLYNPSLPLPLFRTPRVLCELPHLPPGFVHPSIRPPVEWFCIAISSGLPKRSFIPILW